MYSETAQPSNLGNYSINDVIYFKTLSHYIYVMDDDIDLEAMQHLQKKYSYSRNIEVEDFFQQDVCVHQARDKLKTSLRDPMEIVMLLPSNSKSGRIPRSPSCRKHTLA